MNSKEKNRTHIENKGIINTNSNYKLTKIENYRDAEIAMSQENHKIKSKLKI